MQVAPPGGQIGKLMQKIPPGGQIGNQREWRQIHNWDCCAPGNPPGQDDTTHSRAA